MIKVICTVFSLLTLLVVDAQKREIISTAGGDDLNGAMYYSYTIGEVVAASSQVDTLFLTSGFEQSNVVVSINVGAQEIKVNAKVYPNPSINYFNLELVDIGPGDYSVVMHNNKGDFIMQQKFHDDRVRVDTRAYPAGIYYLTVIDESGNRLNQFKIIKSE